jgi:hypothetical protein
MPAARQETAVKITVQDVRDYGEAREGCAYSATILLDGETVGSFEDRGGGGALFITFKDVASRMAFEHAAAQWSKENGGQSEEIMLSGLADESALLRDAREMVSAAKPLCVLVQSDPWDMDGRTLYGSEFLVVAPADADLDELAALHGAVAWRQILPEPIS